MSVQVIESVLRRLGAVSVAALLGVVESLHHAAAGGLQSSHRIAQAVVDGLDA